MKRDFIFYLFVGITLMQPLMTSCTKRCKAKLEGQWEKVKIENLDDTLSYFWVFGRITGNGDGSVETYYKLPDNTKISKDSGSYYMESKFSKCIIHTENFGEGIMSGKWEILRLNNDELIIINRLESGGGITQLEFCKTSCN